MRYTPVMNREQGTLERAFALARSGECASVGEIRLRLKKERCDAVEAHLSGPSISRQLRALCDAARKASGTTADAAASQDMVPGEAA